MDAKTFIQVIEYVEKIENPLVLFIAVLFIGFLLYRKFFSADFKIRKQNFDEMLSLYNATHQELAEVKKKYSEIKTELDLLKYENEQLKRDHESEN